VDEMLGAGLVDEVINLMNHGYGPELNSMQALGYRQVYAYLDGILTYQEMVNEIKRETRHFAKRQYTWFNKDKRIHWIDISGYEQNSQLMEQICSVIEGHLTKL
jgi:tRNA dimethylallyltransferase